MEDPNRGVLKVSLMFLECFFVSFSPSQTSSSRGSESCPRMAASRTSCPSPTSASCLAATNECFSISRNGDKEQKPAQPEDDPAPAVGNALERDQLHGLEVGAGTGDVERRRTEPSAGLPVFLSEH